jgi:hypothetical protein
MFGDVWPLKQWAGLGAVIGVLYQALQVVNQGLLALGYSYVSGRLLGGVFVGAAVGALVALVRNQLAGRNR